MARWLSVNSFSKNGNRWLENIFICEQQFEVKFINANNEEYSFQLCLSEKSGIFVASC